MEGSSKYWLKEAEEGVAPLKILVRAANSEKLGRDEATGMAYRYVNFHTFDLDRHKICFKTLPTILSLGGRGDMVRLDEDEDDTSSSSASSSSSSIYIIVRGQVENMRRPLAVETDKYLHKGASRLRLRGGDGGGGGGWETAPLLPSNPIFPSCVSFLGMVYSFGYDKLKPYVFDPATDEWTDLTCSVPSQLASLSVSSPILPDTARRRIILHLYSPSTLVAFYPDTRQWESLTCDPDLSYWHDDSVSVALLNHVLYFYDHERYPSPVQAFDVCANKWLTVVWSSTTLGDIKYLNLIFFNAIFTWSAGKDNMLCLASFVNSVGFQPPFTTAAFLRLKVSHTDGGGGDSDSDSGGRSNGSTLTLTPVSIDIFKIPSAIQVLDFVPLHEV